MRKSSVFAFLCLKDAAFSFIRGKTCFGVLAMKSDVSSILLQKNSDFVFRF